MSRAARAISAAGVAAVAMAVVSGCGGSTAGSPVPANTGFDTDSSESSRPPRPRELRIDGKDPCGLVPESDWTYFYIEEPGNLKHNETYKSPECLYINEVGNFSIVLVVTEGMEVWFERKRRSQPGDTEPVAGFPAITLSIPDWDHRCNVAVDVADGQYVLASVSLSDRKRSSVPEPCEYAHQWAESAMKTLVPS